MTSASNNQLCDWGEATADDQRNGLIDADAFVVLHFFAAVKFSANSFGATRSQAGPDQTTGQIRTAAQRYGECWFNGNPGAGKTLKLALGVTNDLLQNAWAGAHGEAWANMVKNANDWASTNGYAAKLSFNGGFDAEDTFGTAQPAKNWATGYRSATNPWSYFFYGDAEGCPSDKNPSSSCSWNRDDVLYVAWEQGVTTAFPQIYDEEPTSADPPTSVNAQQWQKLSERAAAVGSERINFAGGLSQLQACIDQGHPASCSGVELGPKVAWRDLWNEINCTYDSGPCTTFDDLRWTSELTWDQSP